MPNFLIEAGAGVINAMATVPQKSHDTAPAVLDSDAHQFAVEYAKLSVNGKRHARAMIAGLVRLEQSPKEQL